MERSNERTVGIWIVGGFLALGILMALLMSWQGPAWMGGSWTWMMPLGMLFMALVVLAIVWALMSVPRPAAPMSPADPMRELESRYARGEISRDEFQRIREDLRGR